MCSLTYNYVAACVAQGAERAWRGSGKGHALSICERFGNCPFVLRSCSPRKRRRFQTIFQDVQGNVHMLFHGYQWQGLWTGMHAYSKDLTTCALALPLLLVNVCRRDKLAL